ncbi:MAG: excinuclease ABC subunit UvrA [Firmicutes bacterium]|uniref:UvrABC system protein A n=1 Tax=Candidatus Colimorpha enterica TaxID=3083063 RepID=A0AAE3FFN2_9BACT|nr:excinuclease ABC subunit UvrA [Candidatus Colimorpha enterica]
MSLSSIIVKGARVHNLKNIDVTVPRDRFVVFTGLSGSGKSSLAFDTIYAEGHRRFVESLSSYARMFLGQLDKPDVDLIEGLSPAISIDQKTTSKNPRSTVGTVTEIYDYLRLMYARIGIPHCPVCGKEIRQQSIDQIIDDICSLPAGTKFMILAPVVSGKKGMHEKVFEDAKKNGYVRVRVDGEMYDVNDIPELEKNKKHTVDIVVDRLVMKEGIRGRLTDSAETALNLAKGNLHIVTVGDTPEEYRYSQNYACEEHGFSMGELSPRMFSFNNPYGACERCAGIGELRTVSFDLICPDRSLSLADGAVAVNGFKSLDDSTWTAPLYEAVGERHGFTLDMPIKDYSKAALDALLNGTGDEIYEIDRSFDGRHAHQRVKFEGILSIIEQRYSMSQNEYYEQFFEFIPCPKCKGRRLRDEVLAVTVGGLSVDALCSLSIDSALDFVNALKLTKTEEAIARDIVKELRSRLGFLKNVGLGYLTLSRKAGTLSGGESQRIRLATQIGSSLMGVLYILDEPSIGLHQRDNHRLIEALKALRDIGNSLIVVEHDEETMMEADYIVDIGPGAGINGGQVVAVGTPQEIIDNPASITGDYLSGRRKIAVPEKRREGSGKFLQIIGARQNNLKNINVAIPLGMLVCVTGVSGSGKSSLINSILYPVLAKQLNRAVTHPGKHDRIEGIDNLDKVIAIDQSPIGRTPRSNPATYTGLFNDIRELFASTNDAKIRGYKAGRFSFNIKGGRCEACEGDGVKCIEMHFLPDVYVTCDVCKGKRYNRDTLEVKYKGKNIFDVLDMTVDEGLAFFENIPKISRRLKTLADVGLGYIKIGQSSTTLSGGEAQRVKLATELSKHSTGRTAYILDEPTTGLHSADVDRLISILQRLTDQGNTVIVIEHNLDLIKTADYIIDMGPEGGDMGGTVIACGTPEQVAEVKGSYTGYYLKNILAR